MSNRNPTTETMTQSELLSQIDSVLDRVSRREARVVVECDGAPVAAVVSADDLERLQHFDERLAERRALLEEARAPFKSVPPEEIEREVAMALAEVRAERRVAQGAPVRQ